MPFKSKPAAWRSCRSGFAAFLFSCGLATVTPAAAEGWPSRVDATYRISFNGFDVGKFEFKADVTGSTYTAQGEARLSALLGAFKWEGDTRSAGHVAGLNPRPAGYTFDYRGIGKEGSIKLGFQAGKVASITNLPPQPPAPDAVPIKDTQLKDVLDPLSAVLALSRTGGSNPCGRRLAIFDGKQRFDLVFTYLRQQAVAETKPSGQPGVAVVCRVNYVPIAGHRMTEETRHMATTEGIEVMLRPVPSAALFVPYQISIPTVAGSATLTSERISIVTRSELIALTN